MRRTLYESQTNKSKGPRKNTVQVTNTKKQTSKIRDSEHDDGCVDNGGGDGICLVMLCDVVFDW